MRALLCVAMLSLVRAQDCRSVLDFTDADYGGHIRQLLDPAGHEHNLYYDRNPWNADNSYLLGIRSDLDQRNWRVVLYDGDGCFLRELFPVEKYDWRLTWDRNDPDVLYTWHGSNLYRYHVSNGSADRVRSFAPLGLKPRRSELWHSN